MANGNGITAEQMIAAIKEAQGYVSKASEILGVARKTFYVYLKKYVTVQEALEDEREKRHDKVELKLMDKIDRGDTTAIIFYLKTQAKHRGYVERQEITGADGNDMKIKVTLLGND